MMFCKCGRLINIRGDEICSECTWKQKEFALELQESNAEQWELENNTLPIKGHGVDQ